RADQAAPCAVPIRGRRRAATGRATAEVVTWIASLAVTRCYRAWCEVSLGLMAWPIRDRAWKRTSFHDARRGQRVARLVMCPGWPSRPCMATVPAAATARAAIMRPLHARTVRCFRRRADANH